MTPKTEIAGAPASVRRCPICGKPESRVERERPFCSRRCADIDLHRWLNGAYAVPVQPDEDEQPEQAQPEPD